MPAQHSVCRVCCDTVEDNDAELIGEGLKGMLQSVLTKIDLTVSENPVICNRCHEKLETNYTFKTKCIFTEDSITPFVAENVKLNLKEIRNQIIKAEYIDNDKNVCRLCLQFVDNDMTLSDHEKEHFQKYFPEINLSRTNFVILCSACYDSLEKYFTFVTSCLELEQQLCNYSLDQAENKINDAVERASIKLEDFLEFIKNTKEEDKELELKEEVDIKCETEEGDERCDRNNQEIEQIMLMKNEESDSDIFLDNSMSGQEDDVDKFNNPKKCVAETAIFKRNHCNKVFGFKGDLKNNIVTMHTADSKITWYKCKYCDRKYKRKYSLNQHILTFHTDPSKRTWYQCQHCDKKFNNNSNLKRHVLDIHTDHSKIIWYQCEQCDKKFKQRDKLKKHVIVLHTDPSKITWYQCEYCSQKCKTRLSLKKHTLNIHADPPLYQCESCGQKFEYQIDLKHHNFTVHAHLSKTISFQCEQCDKEFKCFDDLKSHDLSMHTDPLSINWYQCEQCDQKYRHHKYLKKHILDQHTDPSEIAYYQCEHCGYKFRSKYHLKKHITGIHADPSKITWYQCQHCDKRFKFNYMLNTHVRNVHTKASELTWYECEHCSRKFKHRPHLKRHMNIHADPSEITWYQCEQCDNKFKFNHTLKVHVRNIHTDTSENIQ